ncbi:MAG: D-alanine--D-alanine ligase family protein, partial [Thermoguttaceae bacterium]
VAHNAIDADARADDLDVLVQAEAVSDALRRNGHTVDALPVSLNLADLREAVAAIRPDVAFNLVESLDGHDRLGPLAPWLLEALNCPYTGAPAGALASLSDKVRAKVRLRRAGLPTPDWVAHGGLSPSHPGEAAGDSPPAAPRYIIKPIHDHGSAGIGPDSIVGPDTGGSVLAALAERERRLARPCFAERFIDGREFNLSVLAGPGGPEVLPAAEIVFVDFPAEEPRIVDYAAKWEPDSFVYRNTPRRFDFPDSDRALLRELNETAEACWHVFGLKGYARVDFRVDADARPWVLEVNANPCLSPDAGFAAAVERAGYAFREAVDRMVADALGEYQHLPAAVRTRRPLPAHWPPNFENAAGLRDADAR